MDIKAIEKLTTGDRVFAAVNHTVDGRVVQDDISLIRTSEVIEVIFLQYSSVREAISVADAKSGHVFCARVECVFLSWENACEEIMEAIDAKLKEFTNRHNRWFAAAKDTAKESD